MRALITAGGRGTRLRPITHTLNKHLIPIANKPILHYALEYVAEAGVREAGIIINPDDDHLKEVIGSGDQWGMKITYIPQDAPLGLAHCIRISRDFLKGEPFIFYLGDNMVIGGIQRFLEAFKKEGSNCHLTLARVSDPERFGVPEIKDNRIVGVEEKPRQPKSQFAVSGIYFYDESIFEAVDKIQPSARGELEISDAHQYLLDHGARVTFSEITGWWKDTGKPEDLLQANRLVLNSMEPSVEGEVDEASQLDGPIIVQKGARIINSVLRGPAIIGEGTIVENSYIGPFTSIYHHCAVRDSEVEFSIALSNCSILNVGSRVENSILGDNVTIRHSEGKPRTHRLMIGDQGVVELA